MIFTRNDCNGVMLLNKHLKYRNCTFLLSFSSSCAFVIYKVKLMISEIKFVQNSFSFNYIFTEISFQCVIISNKTNLKYIDK